MMARCQLQYRNAFHRDNAYIISLKCNSVFMSTMILSFGLQFTPFLLLQFLPLLNYATLYFLRLMSVGGCVFAANITAVKLRSVIINTK